MSKKCGKRVKYFHTCVLEKDHSGECAPACDKQVTGRNYRVSIVSHALVETCVLPEAHTGHCEDRLGNGPYPYLKEFSLFDTKQNVITVYDSEEKIISSTLRIEIKEVEK